MFRAQILCPHADTVPTFLVTHCFAKDTEFRTVWPCGEQITSEIFVFDESFMASAHLQCVKHSSLAWQCCRS